MQDKKQKKAKIQVIFLILISTLVILADFYAIISYPKEYMLIAAITVIFMICLWGVISGFFSLSALTVSYTHLLRAIVSVEAFL